MLTVEFLEANLSPVPWSEGEEDWRSGPLRILVTNVTDSYHKFIVRLMIERKGSDPGWGVLLLASHVTKREALKELLDGIQSFDWTTTLTQAAEVMSTWTTPRPEGRAALQRLLED